VATPNEEAKNDLIVLLLGGHNISLLLKVFQVGGGQNSKKKELIGGVECQE